MRKSYKNIKIVLFVLSLFICFGKINVYAAEMQKVITGFDEFDVNENALHLLIEYKPSLEELEEMLPDTLGVYLDDEEEVVEIDVDWFCVAEDYEESDNFYFQFSPMWDENEYQLSEEISLLEEAPYIGVFFTTEEQAVSAYAVTNNSNEEKIFKFLTENLGYNVAAACGVMANLYSESAFIPTNLENLYESKLGYNDLSYTYAVDSGKYTNFVRDTAGYGLCQWTYWTRKQELLNFAKKSGTSIGDLNMQLNFMKKEITGTSTDKYARAASNTADGAYKVGYYYCENYERPAQKKDEKSVSRGNLAKNTYWKEYCDRVIDFSIRISGQNVPGTMTAGSSFRITGILDSDVNITNITLGIYDYSGAKKGGNSFNPNEKGYDLSRQNPMMGFDKLEPGVYVYKVSAANDKKTVHLIDKKFVVLANNKTIGDGTYMIQSRGTETLVVDVANHSNSSGANLQLNYKENSKYQFYEIKHVGGGYYTIKNCASGKYVDVLNGTAANQTNVQQKDYSGNAAQKWQILRLGDSVCFVPQCATAYCLNIQNSGTTAGTNVQIYEANLNTAQKFKLLSGKIQEIFTDVKDWNWFYDYVEYVYKNDLMSGNAYEGKFNPNTAVTRAQVITTLYRLAGSPKVTDYSACTVFSDVEKDKYYTDAVCWAYNEGVTTGNPNSRKFNTTASITRQQLATFFFRYAEYKGYKTSQRADISSMLNAVQVKDYAKEAVQWAVATDMISGSETKDSAGNIVFDLKPMGTATRAQLAAILYRFCDYNDL